MDLATQISLFSTIFMGIFIEAVSFLLLGTLVSGLIEVFIRKEDVARLMPRNPIAGVIAGSFLGILFPVCECGVVPVTRRLYQKGLPVSVGITFLLAAPVMNPIVLASTYAAYGFGPILVGRYLITMIMAISVGLLFTLQRSPQRLLSVQAIAAFSGGSSAVAAQGERVMLIPGVLRALKLAGGEFFEIGRYLVIGCALAAAMQTYIGQEQLRGVATHPALSVLAMSALAFILSLCSTTDAIVSLSFLNNGFSVGSILNFLTFGPMVDIKSLMMYLTIFRRKIVLYMAILPFLIALLIGIWLNLNVRF